MDRPSGPLPPPPPPQNSDSDGLEAASRKTKDTLSAQSPQKNKQDSALAAVDNILPNIQSNASEPSSGSKDEKIEKQQPAPPPSHLRQQSQASKSLSKSHSNPSTPKVNEAVEYSHDPSDYDVGAVIGFGSSAIVYVAKYLAMDDHPDVAIKMINLDQFERNQIDELRKEIQVMTMCKHPNLTNILASFVDNSRLWIVTPFSSVGSCQDILKSSFKEGLEEIIIATILHQALQGLQYLHKSGHIHRDVKAANLLMNSEGCVQLADFGVSSTLTDDIGRKGGGVRKTFVGTPCWMAPEVMEVTKGYNEKADIWSFGITALELAMGHAPYSKYPPMKVIYMTLSNPHSPTLDRKRAKHKYSRAFKEMIDLCLQKDPTRRPSCDQLLKHSFFKAVKKQRYLVENIVSCIPPIQERITMNKKNAARLANASSAAESFGEDDGEEALSSSDWDFSEDGKDIASTLNNSSRFVVDSSSTLPEHQSPSSRDTDEDDDCESTIRKGRFSVLDGAVNKIIAEELTASGDGDDEGDLEHRSAPVLRDEEPEEGRTSRFHVTHHPLGQVGGGSNTVPPNAPLLEQYTALLTPGGKTLANVNPNHFDQLLMMNELMRQQIIELRNASISQSLGPYATPQPSLGAYTSNNLQWVPSPNLAGDPNLIIDSTESLPCANHLPKGRGGIHNRSVSNINQRPKITPNQSIHRPYLSMSTAKKESVENLKKRLDLLQIENQNLRKAL